MKHLLLRCLMPLALVVAPGLALSHGDEEHGDHDAHHGGFVLMYQDIHFEVTAAAGGGVQVYYTDGARNELPAAVVSDVVVEIERPGEQIEYLTMGISEGGDFWEGASGPISNPDTVVRVGFLYNGKPLMLNVPASSLMTPADEAADSGMMSHSAGHAGH